MLILRETQSTEDVIKELRDLADALESKKAFLHSGSFCDQKRYGEQRQYTIEITVIMD